MTERSRILPLQDLGKFAQRNAVNLAMLSGLTLATGTGIIACRSGSESPTPTPTSTLRPEPTPTRTPAPTATRVPDAVPTATPYPTPQSPEVGAMDIGIIYDPYAKNCQLVDRRTGAIINPANPEREWYPTGKGVKQDMLVSFKPGQIAVIEGY